MHLPHGPPEAQLGVSCQGVVHHCRCNRGCTVSITPALLFHPCVHKMVLTRLSLCSFIPGNMAVFRFASKLAWSTLFVSPHSCYIVAQPRRWYSMLIDLEPLLTPSPHRTVHVRTAPHYTHTTHDHRQEEPRGSSNWPTSCSTHTCPLPSPCST